MADPSFIGGCAMKNVSAMDFNLRSAENTFEKVIRLFDIPPSRRRVFLFAGCAIIFVLVFALNLLQPCFTDDWEYAFVYRLFDYTNKGLVPDERIASLPDIFRSQYSHYFSWGGRSVNHIIAQILLYIGSPFNKILNAGAYVLFVLVLCKFAKRKNEPIRISTLLLINILLFLFIPALGSTILWITGSANYLWGTLILLLFLLPYKNLYQSGEEKYSFIFKSAYLFLGGIIAGWTNENMVAAALFILIIYFIYLRNRKIRIPLWFYTGLLGAIAGFCLMSFAPGNYIRYQKTLEVGGVEGLSKMSLFIDQFLTAMSGIFFYLLPLIAIYSLLLIAVRYVKRKDEKMNVLSLVFFLSAMLAILAMSFAPVFPKRAWFGIIALLVVAIVTLYNELDFSIVWFNKLRFVLFFFCIVAVAGGYVSGYKDLKRANAVFEKRELQMAEGKRKGKLDFVFEKEIRTKSRINNLYDLTEDPNYWTNCFYARYYNVNSVVVTPTQE